MLIRDGHSHVSLEQMHLNGCSAPMGGAIAVRQGGLELTGVNITHARGECPVFPSGRGGGGGAVRVSDGGFALLIDSAIVDARAHGFAVLGGGLYVDACFLFSASASSIAAREFFKFKSAAKWYTVTPPLNMMPLSAPFSINSFECVSLLDTMATTKAGMLPSLYVLASAPF